MTQTFIDTIVVCSLTGLVILMTGVWDSGETGARLTQQAFNVNLPGELGGIIVSIGMILFAYSTIIGWSYYGEKSLEYLLGERSVVPYRLIFTGMVFVGAISRLDFVWLVSDVMNALMAVPNLVGLLLLSGVVYKVTRSYFKAKAEGELF